MQNEDKKNHVAAQTLRVRPDCHVEWGNVSMRDATDVFCSAAPLSAGAQVKTSAPWRQVMASLHTDTTYVEVSDVNFVEPTELFSMPCRPGFCLLTSKASTTLIDYGYQNGSHRVASLEDVLFMVPGRKICARFSAGTFRTVTCSFEPPYAERILGSFENLSLSQLAGALDLKSALVNCILLRLMNEALFPGPISAAIVESLGNTLLVECARWLLSTETRNEPQGRLSARHIQIIEEYLLGLSARAKAPSVAELAGKCGFSERYFATLFRQQFGCPVSQYLKSVQISRAKAYLLETQLQLKEIAYRLGFKSLSNFSFAFKEATGVAPGQFRKQG